MPSPVGHTMLNLSLWILADRHPASNWRFGLYSCFVGLISDIDIVSILFGASLATTHRRSTHSALFAVFVSFIFSLILSKGKRWTRVFMFFLVLTFGHLFLDYMTIDNNLSPGIQFFWPFSKKCYDSAYHIFAGFDLTTWQNLFSFTTLKSIFGEFILLLPLFLAAIAVNVYRRQSTMAWIRNKGGL